MQHAGNVKRSQEHMHKIISCGPSHARTLSVPRFQNENGVGGTSEDHADNDHRGDEPEADGCARTILTRGFNRRPASTSTVTPALAQTFGDYSYCYEVTFSMTDLDDAILCSYWQSQLPVSSSAVNCT